MRLETLTFQAEAPQTELLQQWLPSLLANLSLGRAQIAIDQVRAVLQDPNFGKIRLVTARSHEASERVVAAAIVIQAVGNADTATVIHAGMTNRQTSDSNSGHPIRDVPSDSSPSIALGDAEIRRMGDCLIGELGKHAVRFVQWATDPTSSVEDNGGETSSDAVSNWCRHFGFQRLATLDYMSGPIAPIEDAPSNGKTIAPTGKKGRPNGKPQPASLAFEPVNWDALPASLNQFESLVQKTYLETLDCPKLCQYRTADQTLQGYRDGPAFEPRYWFTAEEVTTRTPAGCLVLGVHGKGGTPPPVLEIIYMGLIPESRSQGLADGLIEQAMQCAKSIGCERVILAVDQKNVPALRLYQRFGLESMMSEDVWCRTIA